MGSLQDYVALSSLGAEDVRSDRISAADMGDSIGSASLNPRGYATAGWEGVPCKWADFNFAGDFVALDALVDLFATHCHTLSVR
jgi:hypothetical protein